MVAVLTSAPGAVTVATIVSVAVAAGPVSLSVPIVQVGRRVGALRRRGRHERQARRQRIGDHHPGGGTRPAVGHRHRERHGFAHQRRRPCRRSWSRRRRRWRRRSRSPPPSCCSPPGRAGPAPTTSARLVMAPATVTVAVERQRRRLARSAGSRSSTRRWRPRNSPARGTPTRTTGRPGAGPGRRGR